MPMFAAGHYPGTISGNLIHLMTVGTSNKGGRMGQHKCGSRVFYLSLGCLRMLESMLSVDVGK